MTNKAAVNAEEEHWVWLPGMTEGQADFGELPFDYAQLVSQDSGLTEEIFYEKGKYHRGHRTGQVRPHAPGWWICYPKNLTIHDPAGNRPTE